MDMGQSWLDWVIIHIYMQIQGNCLCSYLKQTKLSFFKQNREQEGRIGPVWEGWYQCVGEDTGRGFRRSIWCQYCVQKYVNGKMRLVETIPGMGEEK
jgi:hypothetical protein